MQKTYKIVKPAIKWYWKKVRPKTAGARAIVLNYDASEILLVQNTGNNKWSFPGGKMNKGEVPEKCLARELKEELDFDSIEIIEKLGEYTNEAEGKQDRVHIYIVRRSNKYFKKEWELDDAAWFRLNALPLELRRATCRRIKEFQCGERDILREW